MARTALETLTPSMKVVLNVENVGLTPQQFFRLCSDNRDFRIELTAQKEIIIMSPSGSKTGWRSGEIFRQVANWAKDEGTGLAFDSSTGFILPNGAERSPDASWIDCQRWNALTHKEQEMFAPICPDFVVELRSPSDPIGELRAKMEEYMANGARLGFLIDPFERTVHVYRPNRPVEPLQQPSSVAADQELPGFRLELDEVWRSYEGGGEEG